MKSEPTWTSAGRAVSAFIDPQMILIVAGWALNLSLIKIALAEIPPLAFNAVRLVLSSLVLLAVLFRVEKNIRIARRDLFKFLILSVSGYTLYQGLFILGIHSTTAANTAVILGASPIVISLLASFFKHERITALGWLGIFLGFAGVYLVIRGRTGGFRFAPQTLKGDLMLFAAVFLWAYYSVSARPLLRVYSPLKFNAVTMSLGTLLFLPFSFSSVRSMPVFSVSLKAWACLLYSAIVALCVASIIWFTSVKRVGNSQTAVYSNLQPVLAILFAHFLLNEAVTGGLMAGTALIFTGIYFTRCGRKIPSSPG